VLSRLVAAEQEGDRLDETELVAVTFELISAGHETTAKLITNALCVLLTDRSQLTLLLEDPSLIPAAVEEIIRYESSGHMCMPRIATEDVVVAGRTIAKGDTVIALMGAANRDPGVFDDPTRFDVTRSPNDHVGFGSGVHFCIGHLLARRETRIALERILHRFPDIALATDDLEWICTSMTRSVASLPVRWSLP
jgi:cytochrome P450